MLALALSLLAPAHALDCAAFQVGDVMPFDGQVDLPTNVRPVARVYGGSLPGSGEWDEVVVTLTEDGADAVAVSVSILEADSPSWRTWRIEPMEELAPESSYTLSIEYGDGSWEGAATTFSTGAGPDTEPPEAAVSDGVFFDAETDEWGDWSELTIALEGGEDQPGNWWKIELADNPDFDDALVRSSLVQPARLSDNPCVADEAVSLGDGEVWVRATTIDPAGNTSTGEARAFDAEASGPGGECGTTGCSITSAPIAGGVAALAGLVVVGRRRD